jgi:carboxypeptidase Taq
VVERLGYDFTRGRIDKTHHPFMTKFALGDIRITTRVNLRDLGDCLFSLIHEAGHAMYEQGIDLSLDGTPLAGGTSAGVHESQSRTWENIVGRVTPSGLISTLTFKQSFQPVKGVFGYLLPGNQ